MTRESNSYEASTSRQSLEHIILPTHKKISFHPHFTAGETETHIEVVSMATQKSQALYWNQDLAPKRVIPKLTLFFRNVSASLHLSDLQQPVYPPC